MSFGLIVNAAVVFRPIGFVVTVTFVLASTDGLPKVVIAPQRSTTVAPSLISKVYVDSVSG